MGEIDPMITLETTASPSSATQSRPATQRGSIPYIPALDGLRAVAVVAVIAFHFGIAGVPGGFLGVDVFFVLSGYLITSLITTEWRESGGLSLGSFWGRRARRLFPALGITLIGVCTAAAFLDSPDQLAGLRSDAVSTLFYVANWHYIASSQNYFAHFGLPSPLLHTWSLAVEEQFYLFWPLITVLIVAVLSKRSVVRSRSPRAWLAMAAGGGALASSAWMALSFRYGHDPSRIYYGTDTHAQVILVGALLALAGPSASWLTTKARRLFLYACGTIGALFVAWEMHVLSGSGGATGSRAAGGVTGFLTATLGSPGFLYRGGYLLFSVSVAAVIALVVCRQESIAAQVLAFGPIRYLGRISYGLYLYHWPAFTFLDPSSTGMHGLALLGIRSAVTVAVSVASYHLVETPIRQGWGGRLSARHQLIGLLPAGTAAVVAAIVLTTSTAATAASPTRPSIGSAAAATHPVRVLLVGDSVSLTLGIGLSNRESHYHVALNDQGQLGCSIAETNPVRVSGAVDTLPPCNPITGQDWQQFWGQEVTATRPDVVAVLLGRWEVVDRSYQGQWTHIGDPSYDAYLAAQLDQAVAMLARGGAQVVLLTAPYFNEPASAFGSVYPENSPARVDRWNAILREVAARHSGTVTVVDFGGMLSASGHYASVVDGVPVRCPDGVHLSFQGGELVAPLVLPILEHVGALAYQRSGAGSTVSPVAPAAVPRGPTNPQALRAQVADRAASPTCPFDQGQ